jgi:hypothetical protein
LVTKSFGVMSRISESLKVAPLRLEFDEDVVRLKVNCAAPAPVVIHVPFVYVSVPSRNSSPTLATSTPADGVNATLLPTKGGIVGDEKSTDDVVGNVKLRGWSGTIFGGVAMHVGPEPVLSCPSISVVKAPQAVCPT